MVGKGRVRCTRTPDGRTRNSQRRNGILRRRTPSASRVPSPSGRRARSMAVASVAWRRAAPCVDLLSRSSVRRQLCAIARPCRDERVAPLPQSGQRYAALAHMAIQYLRTSLSSPRSNVERAPRIDGSASTSSNRPGPTRSHARRGRTGQLPSIVLSLP